MKSSNRQDQNTPHAPGSGSDKHHPETPPNADERFNQQKKKENGGNIQENPENQNTG